MTVTPHAYYLNSLKAWKLDFQREQTIGHARLKRLEAMDHPCTDDHRRCMQMRQGWIDQITSEISALSPAERRE